MDELKSLVIYGFLQILCEVSRRRRLGEESLRRKEMIAAQYTPRHPSIYHLKVIPSSSSSSSSSPLPPPPLPPPSSSSLLKTIFTQRISYDNFRQGKTKMHVHIPTVQHCLKPMCDFIFFIICTYTAKKLKTISPLVLFGWL